ncbi:MAG: methyltransferase [Bacteroidota bacterium]
MLIEQDQCAMKVSTDACILGAWTPIPPESKTVLDIGTGTGLLSLMLAQRNESLKIDALEIDSSAAKQASENISNSIFFNQISVIEYDAKAWQNDLRYDLIICNPPFFSNSLKGNNQIRNMARHNDDFSFDDLLKVVSVNLKSEGTASILLPISEMTRCETAIKKTQLKQSGSLLIKPFAHQEPNRIIVLLNYKDDIPFREELVIYKEQKLYTKEFIDLLSPFYLHL